MNDERSRGIILRTRRLTETSLIVQWLTEDLGRISTVAKGACRPKSSFRGKLDLYFEAEFSFQRSRRSELHTLREISLQETHPALRTDLSRLEQLAYFAMLLEQATERETPLPEFYQLFLEALKALEAHPPKSQTVLSFEARLLDLLGLAPDLANAPISEGSRHLFSMLLQDDWAMVFKIQPSASQSAELARFLHHCLSQQIDRIPASRAPALLAH